MSISAAATETVAITLLAECRRCLAVGSPLAGSFIKMVIDQLENATVTDTTGRANIVPNTLLDGRSTVEVAVIT